MNRRANAHRAFIAGGTTACGLAAAALAVAGCGTAGHYRNTAGDGQTRVAAHYWTWIAIQEGYPTYGGR